MQKVVLMFTKLLSLMDKLIKTHWKPALKGMAIYFPFYVVFMGYFLDLGVGKWFDILFTIILGLVGFICSFLLLYLIIFAMKAIPKKIIYAIAGFIGSIYMIELYLGPYFRFLAYMILIVGAIVGITVTILRNKRISFFWKIITVAITISVHLVVVWIVLTPGPLGSWKLDLKDNIPPFSNPLDENKYEVHHFTYGSGSDKRREEFGDLVDYETKNVNMSPFTVSPKGINAFYRKWFWGFELNYAPVNGRVWMPKDEEGPFPLVLIVHGNHNMVEFSDRGYAYLGEMLAKKGYIAVSVDQNFLNSNKIGHIGWDNAGRAWLLLKHLELLNDWNVQMDHILYRKVDIDNIALIGHSRGGEAISIASLLNRLERFPNNARVKLNFDFAIKSLIGLSPGEGRFNPGDLPITLEDVNYLTIQGSHDTDHTSNHGIKTYNRVIFSDNFDGFKSSIYIYGGNHGQFNTDWITDRKAPYSWFINRSALLDPKMQQHITSFYVASFLDATLKDKKELREVFANKEVANSWVPTDPLRIQYEESQFTPLATFEEDVDVVTMTNPVGNIDGKSLRVWREIGLTLRNGDFQNSRAVKLGWLRSSSRYILDVPENVAETFSDQTFLRFDAIQVHESRYAFHGIPMDESIKERSIPIVVTIKPKSIHQFDSRIQQTIYIEPTYTSELYRWNWRNNQIGNNYEQILQSYEIPISYLKEHFPDIDYADVHQIVFSLDVTDSGIILLDNIGFSEKAH